MNTSLSLRQNVHSGIAITAVGVCSLGAAYMIVNAAQIDDFYAYNERIEQYTTEPTQ